MRGLHLIAMCEPMAQCIGEPDRGYRGEDGGGGGGGVEHLQRLRFKNGAADQFGDLRDYGVSERVKSVKPSGYPIIQCAKAVSEFAPRMMPCRFRKPGSSTCILRPFGEYAVLPRQVALANDRPPLRLSGVGNNPDSVSLVRCAKGISGNTVPLRIIPERGQVSENSVKPPSIESCRVLHDCEVWSKLANEPCIFEPKSAALSVQTKSSAVALANILARKPARDNVNGNPICSESIGGEFSHVMVAGHSRPVFRQHLLAEWIDLAERHSLEPASALQPKVEAADASEQRQDAIWPARRKASATVARSAGRAGGRGTTPGRWQQGYLMRDHGSADVAKLVNSGFEPVEVIKEARQVAVVTWGCRYSAAPARCHRYWRARVETVEKFTHQAAELVQPVRSNADAIKWSIGRVFGLRGIAYGARLVGFVLVHRLSSFLYCLPDAAVGLRALIQRVDCSGPDYGVGNDAPDDAQLCLREGAGDGCAGVHLCIHPHRLVAKIRLWGGQCWAPVCRLIGHHAVFVDAPANAVGPTVRRLPIVAGRPCATIVALFVNRIPAYGRVKLAPFSGANTGAPVAPFLGFDWLPVAHLSAHPHHISGAGEQRRQPPDGGQRDTGSKGEDGETHQAASRGSTGSRARATTGDRSAASSAPSVCFSASSANSGGQSVAS